MSSATAELRRPGAQDIDLRIAPTGGLPLQQAFARDVVEGLSAARRHLPSKYFYDAQGSALFERICEQPEYYLTRVELELMQQQAGSIAAALGSRVRLVEFGSGAGHKTRLLLAALDRPHSYVPVEISPAALQASVAALGERFPALPVRPVCADFTEAFTLPTVQVAPARTVVYFPGSTLGNFDAAESNALLRQMRRLAGRDGAVVLGLDLKKPATELEAAYNDAAGITAEFTLNLLARINRELDGDFDLSAFMHRARYDAAAGRIETQIVSRVEQRVHAAGHRFRFAAGEAIDVEISCKYSTADVQRLAATAGVEVDGEWSDPKRRFGVYLLRAAL